MAYDSNTALHAYLLRAVKMLCNPTQNRFWLNDFANRFHNKNVEKTFDFENVKYVYYIHCVC